MIEKQDMPRYLAAMKKLAGLHVVEIAHAEDCGHWQDLPCDCEPLAVIVLDEE